MIKMRRAQLSFGDGLIAEEVSDLRESWMTHADQVLADEQIVAAVYEALMKRHPKSRSRGRRGSPAGPHGGRWRRCPACPSRSAARRSGRPVTKSASPAPINSSNARVSVP